MKEKIEKFLEMFTQISKDEADLIQSVIRWDKDTKMAFIIAKKLFEEDSDDE